MPRHLSRVRVPNAGWLAVVVVVAATSPVMAASVDEQAADVQRLEAASAHRADDPALQRALAIATNNYGLELATAGQLDRAIHHLRRAVQVDTSLVAAHHNLAQVLSQRAAQLMAARRLREAQGLIEEALQHDEERAELWALLGQVHYESQRLALAEQAWRRALTLNPTLREIERRLAQVTKERPVEQTFRTLPQAQFDIRSAEALPLRADEVVREVLLEAYQTVGQEFGHYPSQRLVVLLYTPEQFRELRQAPEWMVAQYDGKLRVPLVDNPRSAYFRSIVWHEFTHAIVHELSHGQCPVWLNEGLAEFEGTKQTGRSFARVQQANQHGELLSLADLQGHFTDLTDPQRIALAYEQSLSIVTYLMDTYGAWRLKRLLKRMGEGTPADEALMQEFRLTRSRLEAQWLAWLNR